MLVDLAKDARIGWPMTTPPADPDPNCPRCKGTGEEPNAQFRCACRWRYSRIPRQVTNIYDAIDGAGKAADPVQEAERNYPCVVCEGPALREEIATLQVENARLRDEIALECGRTEEAERAYEKAFERAESAEAQLREARALVCELAPSACRLRAEGGEVNCGLCKLPIRGDERYTTDHYKCGAELAQSFREEIATLQSDNESIGRIAFAEKRRADAAEAQLREARAQALEDAARAFTAKHGPAQRIYVSNWLMARAASERKEGDHG